MYVYITNTHANTHSQISLDQFKTILGVGESRGWTGEGVVWGGGESEQEKKAREKRDRKG